MYKTNGLGSTESKSGKGSEINATKNIRKHLPDVISNYNINSFFRYSLWRF